MYSKLLCQSFHREWGIRVHSCVALLARATRALFERLRIVKLRKKTIKKALFPHSAPASGLSRICFISNIEIMGRNRTKMKNSITKNPIVPRNVIQSHRVGEYIAQLDGKKSRCKLVITMTNRSS